jgi:hypothetical protein
MKGKIWLPKLGGSTDVLLINGQSFSCLENGPGWAVHFQFGKWSEIFDGEGFSSSENGADEAIIFIMKMVL